MERFNFDEVGVDTFYNKFHLKLSELFDHQKRSDERELKDFEVKPLVTLTTHQPVDSLDWLLINSFNGVSTRSDFSMYSITKESREPNFLELGHTLNVTMTPEQRGIINNDT